MLLFTWFFLVTLTAASKCKSEWESVVFTPQTYSEKYLKLLSHKLSRYSELLFSGEASSIIDAFEQEYGVTVHAPQTTYHLQYLDWCCSWSHSSTYRLECRRSFLDTTITLPSCPALHVAISTLHGAQLEFTAGIRSRRLPDGCPSHPGLKQARSFTILFGLGSTVLGGHATRIRFLRNGIRLE